MDPKLYEEIRNRFLVDRTNLIIVSVVNGNYEVQDVLRSGHVYCKDVKGVTKKVRKILEKWEMK